MKEEDLTRGSGGELHIHSDSPTCLSAYVLVGQWHFHIMCPLCWTYFLCIRIHKCKPTTKQDEGKRFAVRTMKCRGIYWLCGPLYYGWLSCVPRDWSQAALLCTWDACISQLLNICVNNGLSLASPVWLLQFLRSGHTGISGWSRDSCGSHTCFHEDR